MLEKHVALASLDKKDPKIYPLFILTHVAKPVLNLQSLKREINKEFGSRYINHEIHTNTKFRGSLNQLNY